MLAATERATQPGLVAVVAGLARLLLAQVLLRRQGQGSNIQISQGH